MVKDTFDISEILKVSKERLVESEGLRRLIDSRELTGEELAFKLTRLGIVSYEKQLKKLIRNRCYAEQFRSEALLVLDKRIDAFNELVSFLNEKIESSK